MCVCVCVCVCVVFFKIGLYFVERARKRDGVKKFPADVFELEKYKSSMDEWYMGEGGE